METVYRTEPPPEGTDPHFDAFVEKYIALQPEDRQGIYQVPDYLLDLRDELWCRYDKQFPLAQENPLELEATIIDLKGENEGLRDTVRSLRENDIEHNRRKV